MTNFRIYLSSRRRTKNPAGEFVRQVRNGPEREDIESWPQLQAYIYRKARADKVKEPIKAAEPIWTGYRALAALRGLSGSGHPRRMSKGPRASGSNTRSRQITGDVEAFPMSALGQKRSFASDRIFG